MSDFSYNAITVKLVHRFSFGLILLIFPVSDHFVVPHGCWLRRGLPVFGELQLDLEDLDEEERIAETFFNIMLHGISHAALSTTQLN